jgi:hypothetical protein
VVRRWTIVRPNFFMQNLLNTAGALVTLNDCAAALSVVLGTNVPFVRALLEMAQTMVADNGAPDWAVEHIGNIARDLEARTMSRDTGTVAEILGRPARSIAAFFEDHADRFRI